MGRISFDVPRPDLQPPVITWRKSVTCLAHTQANTGIEVITRAS
jgi:hypothetical protein